MLIGVDIIDIEKIVIVYFVIEMSIKIKEDSGSFTNDRDYLFKPNHSGVYYYLVNGDFSFV